jgi:hypothetical protein
MLGTAEAYALRAELDGLLGVVRGIRIGADLELARAVRPAHNGGKIAGHRGFHSLYLLAVYVTG